MFKQLRCGENNTAELIIFIETSKLSNNDSRIFVRPLRNSPKTTDPSSYRGNPRPFRTPNNILIARECSQRLYQLSTLRRLPTQHLINSHSPRSISYIFRSNTAIGAH